MRRIGELLSEDTNQFGPGTDLVISLLAMLLIMFLINGHLYQKEKAKNEAQNHAENFHIARDSFEAGEFMPKPYKKFKDEAQAKLKVRRIVDEYRTKWINQYPYIFVVGHSSSRDDPTAVDKSEEARLVRNWNYAGERAALISSLLQQQLPTEEEKNRIVVLSTGEFDRKVSPADSQDNAWVEVVFGKEWKLPAGWKSESHW